MQDCRNIDSALNCVIIVLLDSYLYNSVLVPFQLVFSTILHVVFHMPHTFPSFHL